MVLFIKVYHDIGMNPEEKESDYVDPINSQKQYSYDGQHNDSQEIFFSLKVKDFALHKFFSFLIWSFIFYSEA
ncbi:hypothetical protein [Leptospira interrogans]|uniref:hypothetical protein n=1 Tax=Leptospira interrogans TaxID=173 RepID=UPI0002B94189|nr:hypothetical protein [Leptospira interrogans]AKP24951.1 hypothetical protein LIMLP_02635 [Leptospira interrogans serovar Manilae]AKP28733.1 hypothetical protein LIMHP_02625 [Leptospira interrogans serovar Manilae]EMJ56294.1 hypothetical protein LEP1GSC013_2837 [Leptospira interrogans serovar Valbuzzi str. Duyster]EYU62963.1 hypothetical protein CI00_17250 [Leptospira interrogans serovar Manilae]